MDYFLYTLAILLALAFLAFQFYPYYKLKRSRGRPAPSLESVLQADQRSQQRLLVYFMAPNCGMCRHTTPIIDELAAERRDVLTLDASAQPDLAGQFGILGTPAFIVIDHGRIEKVRLGALSRARIMQLLAVPQSR